MVTGDAYTLINGKVTSFELSDYLDHGWPFEGVTFAEELLLENCPNIVVPADFRVRDWIIISDGDTSVEFCVESSIIIIVMIYGVKVPLSVIPQYQGKRLDELLTLPQMAEHRYMAWRIDRILVDDEETITVHLRNIDLEISD